MRFFKKGFCDGENVIFLKIKQGYQVGVVFPNRASIEMSDVQLPVVSVVRVDDV